MLLVIIRFTVLLVIIAAPTTFAQLREPSIGDGYLSPLLLASYVLPFKWLHKSEKADLDSDQIFNDKQTSSKLRNACCLVISCPLINARAPETHSRPLAAAGNQGENAQRSSRLLRYIPMSDRSNDDDPEKPGQNNGDPTPVESIICPICHEPVSDTGDELTSCCNRLFHAACLADYCILGLSPSVCPWCRAEPWYRDEHYLVCLISQHHIFPGRTASVHAHRNRLRPWRCSHCRSTFRYEANLNIHLRKQHSYCWFCPIGVGNDFNIEQHNFNHGFYYMCLQCHWAAEDLYELYEHITHDHNFRSPRHDCTCFGGRISYSSMRQQGLCHYVCSLCEHISHSYALHSQHMWTHQLFVCLHCSNRFGSCSELQEHSRGCPIYGAMRY